MKKNLIIIGILSVIIIGLVGGIVYLNYWNKEYKSRLEAMPNVDENFRVIEYDCKFTKTYRIVNLLNGYISEVPEWSYVAVDQFQNMNVLALKVPTELKSNLKENTYYEFTYSIKGEGTINTMEDINNNLVFDDSNAKLKVTLDIRKTDKIGLEQVQEGICKSK